MMNLGPYELGYNDTPECGIYTGDARELSKAIPDESIDLIIADPPYFRIANEGWDKQWRTVQEWVEWCMEWGREAARILKPNGSAYLFGDDKNIAYMQVGFDGLPWGLINSIVWQKTNYTMLKANPDSLRSFQMQGEERILFYGKDITSPSFSEIRNPQAATPMAQYLRGERERSGASMKEIAALFPSKTGGITGCVANWELGYNFPLKEQYEAIRNYLNKHYRNGREYLREEYEDLREEYEDLREEYEDLREEYEDLRRPFNGGKFTDIWTGPLISATHKKHISQKPKWIVDRMLLASSNSGAVVLDMFAGSGVISERAYQLSRNYLAFEVDPATADMARERVHNTQPPLPLVFHEQLDMEL